MRNVLGMRNRNEKWKWVERVSGCVPFTFGLQALDFGLSYFNSTQFDSPPPWLIREILVRSRGGGVIVDVDIVINVSLVVLMKRNVNYIMVLRIRIRISKTVFAVIIVIVIVMAILMAMVFDNIQYNTIYIT